MLTVFISDAVVTAVILNTTFIRALTSLARANVIVTMLTSANLRLTLVCSSSGHTISHVHTAALRSP